MLNIGGGVVAVVEAAYFSAIYFGEGFNSAIFAESRQIKKSPNCVVAACVCASVR